MSWLHHPDEGTDPAMSLRERFTTTYPRLDPHRVRAMIFRRTSWLRRGLDPTAVYAFAARVAAELEARERDLAVVRAENIRIKNALRDWQSQMAVTR